MAATAKEKRMLKRRVLAFVILHALIGLHLLLWYVFDWHLIGAIDMQELFRNLIEKNVLTIGALFFLVFIGAGLLWGRLFCGWLCHIGQAYDLLAALYRKWGLPLKAFPLRLGPLMALFILVWFFLWEAVAHRMEQIPQGLEVNMGLTEPWELLPGFWNGSLTLALVLLVLPMMLGPRTFCRNLCPWGVLLGMANRLSPLKVRRTGNCTMCGLCSPACPMDLDVSRLINTEFRVDSLRCTNCFQCVAACPENALSFALPRKENRRPQKRPLLKPLQWVSWPVEIVFWLLTLWVGLTYSELYGIGIFLAFTLGLIMAWCSYRVVVDFRRGPWLRRLAPALVLLLLWGVVFKDGLAHHHYKKGGQAWDQGNFALAQHHYERCDALFWLNPDLLYFRLYRIYKGSGQETKRKQLYDRFERRRQGKGATKRRED